ncbi:hypothetical protein DFR50_107119 [Roseiarcus fermentans]|uniref:Uncharacterized protein n=1 Tax=Roseiarcus fermentans TaxID=1473586 RepID=A0A366FQ54_9HYPH|nr:hypothetical protein [Roseiarcus fermentans]RBP15849.1 hypothetical protein DFR50_107119 [Roseiarcus fermentans]
MSRLAVIGGATLLGLAALPLAGCSTLPQRLSTACALAEAGTKVAKDVARGGAAATAATVNTATDDTCAGLATAAAGR